MKTINITFKTGITINIPCDDYKEQENEYILVISKNNVASINESPVDFTKTKGVRVD